MPQYIKAIIVIFGVGTILLVFAGFLAARAVSGVAAGFRLEMEKASTDGKAAGREAIHGDCVDLTVQRITKCEGVMCAPMTTAFLRTCLESVPVSAGAFCRNVPPSHDEKAVTNWARRACRTNGNMGDDLCVMTIAPTSAFCESESDPVSR